MITKSAAGTHRVHMIPRFGLPGEVAELVALTCPPAAYIIRPKLDINDGDLTIWPAVSHRLIMVDRTGKGRFHDRSTLTRK
jgi:hypothetical protein